jgi:hypothetical protein
VPGLRLTGYEATYRATKLDCGSDTFTHLMRRFRKDIGICRRPATVCGDAVPGPVERAGNPLRKGSVRFSFDGDMSPVGGRITCSAQDNFPMTCGIYYCGEFVAPDGLEPVAQMLADCSWRVKLIRSGFDGTLYLREDDDRIDLQMVSGQGPEYMFSGIVSGDLAAANDLLTSFSTCLAIGQVVHRIEVYSEVVSEPMLAYFHYGWPQSRSVPTA